MHTGTATRKAQQDPGKQEPRNPEELEAKDQTDEGQEQTAEGDEDRKGGNGNRSPANAGSGTHEPSSESKKEHQGKEYPDEHEQRAQ